jgi:hypothetical protein
MQLGESVFQIVSKVGQQEELRAIGRGMSLNTKDTKEKSGRFEKSRRLGAMELRARWSEFSPTSCFSFVLFVPLVFTRSDLVTAPIFERDPI